MKAPPPNRPKPLRRRGAARVISEASGRTRDAASFVEHPDGWYWTASGGQQFGPFESRAAARADFERYDERVPAEGGATLEAASELGLADWDDTDLGAPGEGHTRPHFEEH